jgi:hypothetical protein
MAPVTRTLILTGGRTGQTVALGGYQFVKGRTVVKADNSQIDGICRYLGRAYKAFEEGSVQLAHYQRLDGEVTANGKREADPSADARHSERIPGSVQSSGTGTASVSADDVGRTDDATSGGAGSVPSGHGHADSGDDGSSGNEIKIREAIASLDPHNDEHWTASGHPRVDAVATVAGIPNLTRSDINEVADDVRRPAR